MGKGMVVLRFSPFFFAPRLDEDSLAFSIPFWWMSQCFELTSSPREICDVPLFVDNFEDLSALTFQPSVSKKWYSTALDIDECLGSGGRMTTSTSLLRSR